MVAHLITLKLILLGNGLRRNASQAVWLVTGVLGGLGLIFALLCVLLAGQALAGPALLKPLTVIAGSVLVAAWVVLPFVFGTDPTLDPARLALFPIPFPKLLLGQAATGLIGVPGICTAAMVTTAAFAWAQGPAAAAVAGASAVLALALCIIAGRLAASTAAILGALRQPGRVLSLLVLVLLSIATMFGILIGSAPGQTKSTTTLQTVSITLAWTPLGAAFSAPEAAAEGRFPEALAKVAIVGTTLVITLWGWSRVLLHALTSRAGQTLARGRAPSSAQSHSMFRWVPQTTYGAIAARTLICLWREPLSRFSVMFMIGGAITAACFASVPGRESAYLYIPCIQAVLATVLMDSLPADSTAFALHLTAGVRGREDLFGRALAFLSYAILGAVLAPLVPVALSGRWELLPGNLGAGLWTILSSTGLFSAAGARFVVPRPPKGSGLNLPPGLMTQRMGAILVAYLICGVVIPAPCYLLNFWNTTGQTGYGWLFLPAGFLFGGLLCAAGIRLGGTWLEQRGPETYSKLAEFS